MNPGDSEIGNDSVHPRTGRIVRIDRGWSTVRLDGGTTVRARNIGADVAVGDHIVLDADGEKIAEVKPRTSALTRRNSFEGARAVRQVVAANIDTVFVVHAVTTEPNPRRLERELVLAFDSGADPVVVITKVDLVDPGYAAEVGARLSRIALDVPVVQVSSVSGQGLDQLRDLVPPGSTVALIGASGAGKSTLVNALVGREVQRTAEVRDDDQRGRHTTVAAELIALPWGAWLLDTPGLRAVTLWTSGRGIEMAFAEVFAAADQCRFRDCKHADEPGCAVRVAIEQGLIAPERLASMRRLVAEELSVEEEMIERERSMDRRGVRRPRRG